MKAPDIKTVLPGPKAKAIIERDHQYTAPAYGRVYPLVVKQGRGMEQITVIQRNIGKAFK